MSLFKISYLQWVQKLVVVILLTTPIFAQEELIIDSTQDTFSENLFLIDNVATETSPSETIPRNNGFLALVQAIIALAFVLVLIYATLFILRKLMKKENTVSSHIHILETQTIKVGSAISIVEIANRLFIVGLGDNVTPIAEICDKDAINAIKLSQSKKPQDSSVRFFSLLKEQLNKKNISSDGKDLPKEEIVQKDFMKNYTNRLYRKDQQTNENEGLHE